MAASRRTCRASSLLQKCSWGIFLCAATFPRHADSGAVTDTTTGLEMLNAHGPHHGSLFKKRFAAFARVPTGAGSSSSGPSPRSSAFMGKESPAPPKCAS